MADARKLRNVSVETYAKRRQSGRSLKAALDDGFELVDRADIVYLPLTLVSWEVKSGFSSEYANVWALCEFKPNDIRKIKFRDGGTSPEGIPAVLKQATANGIGADLNVRIDFTEYEYTDRETGEQDTARRYFFVDEEDFPQNDGTPDEPNF